MGHLLHMSTPMARQHAAHNRPSHREQLCVERPRLELPSFVLFITCMVMLILYQAWLNPHSHRDSINVTASGVTIRDGSQALDKYLARVRVSESSSRRRHLLWCAASRRQLDLCRSLSDTEQRKDKDRSIGSQLERRMVNVEGSTLDLH